MSPKANNKSHLRNILFEFLKELLYGNGETPVARGCARHFAHEGVTLGHGLEQHDWHGARPSPPRGLRWWLRPVPVLVCGLGLSLIGVGLLGAGGTDQSSTDQQEMTSAELQLPGARVGDMVARRATSNGAGRGMDGIQPVGQQSTPADDGTPPVTSATAMPDDLPGTNGLEQLMESADAAADADTAPAAPHEGPEWETIEVRSGDSLAAIFNRAGLSAGDLHRLVNTDDRTSRLQRIYPGDKIHFHVEDDSLRGLRYDLDDSDTLVVSRDDDDDFAVNIESRAIETRVKHASGAVNSSLFVAGLDAGLSHGQIMRLMHIFEWQVDFDRDVRSGDVFSVAYESYYIDDEHVRDGPILAARYVNRGRQMDAVRYTDPDGTTGYYSPEGENLRKAFIRRPVEGARISSHFNPNRKHPVLGVRRPHLGTDFAASSGTPIMASGNGRVVHRGRKGGYGRTIIIEHANRYRTLYAHMSRYASDISVGSRVEQGQTIGYVGASGLVTGAHLHYEFIKDGSHRNPMRVELPSGDPVAEEHMTDFMARAAPLVAQVEDMSEEQLALLDED